MHDQAGFHFIGMVSWNVKELLSVQHSGPKGEANEHLWKQEVQFPYNGLQIVAAMAIEYHELVNALQDIQN